MNPRILWKSGNGSVRLVDLALGESTPGCVLQRRESYSSGSVRAQWSTFVVDAYAHSAIEAFAESLREKSGPLAVRLHSLDGRSEARSVSRELADLLANSAELLRDAFQEAPHANDCPSRTGEACGCWRKPARANLIAVFGATPPILDPLIEDAPSELDVRVEAPPIPTEDALPIARSSDDDIAF